MARRTTLLALLFVVATGRAAPVDFNRDVRPILADNCFLCHGPGDTTRKADLRLDTRDGLRAATKELLARVTATDDKRRMPPAKSGKKLSDVQIATLKAWVDQGANWTGHWAFTKPIRPAIPATKHPTSNSIDAFVRAKLEAEGLAPSAPADKVTLIRRVTLDLTGLPPSPSEVDAFLADDSPAAYERVVERLLASSRFGERMAWRWLEAGRYADTNGYQTDAGRDMWRWRDWVIEAYNRNLPFDRFTIEQIAGDLLPNPTLDQRIATGFHRNHRGNSEGGIVPEEYAVEYVADRVETTGTVWLGLTFTCNRCHDHKYDPFPQADFYRMFAYFNNVPEQGRAAKYGNSPPTIKAPTRDQQAKLAELDSRIGSAQLHASEAYRDIVRAQADWEKTADPKAFPDWAPGRGQVAWFHLDGPGRLKFPDGAATFGPGTIGKAIEFNGKMFADLGDTADFGFDDRFTLACWINPKKPDGAIVSRTVEDPHGEGYSIHLVNGRVQVHLTKRWLDDALRLETETTVPLDVWSHIAVTYDATRLVSGVKVYINGLECKTKAMFDELNQSFANKEPFRIGSGGGPTTRFNGRIDDVRIFDRVLDRTEAWLLTAPESPAEILRESMRSAAAAEKLRTFYIETAAPVELRRPIETLRRLRDEREKLWDAVPTLMVMEERPTPRPAHILKRGEYDKKGPEVKPGVPAALGVDANGPANRLGFAKWLVDPANPLAARVAVNRAWQMHFGTGLVKTTEDFGTQGAFPSHPELLDWLAVEFASDWDVKRLHKLIVTSATYRQTSQGIGDDRWLARFPRRRLSAEVVRDQALLAGGLLVERQGGPSVKPYQPAGLWNELSGVGDYTPDTGVNLYRRSLYTYWKRTAPPPVLATFDAAGREICWVRESRTNTPLQALTLLNETAFVESARNLAARVLRDGAGPDERLTLAFRRVLARSPSPTELNVLRRGFNAHLADFRADPEAAKKLIAVGDSKVDAGLDPVELAAYAAVCNTILNLDEAVTKE